jgi:hypothetical protein
MKCELCGDEYHEQADTRADHFGYVCPGAIASQEERDAYIQAVGVAYLNLLSEVEHYKDTIEERKRLWYQRERSEVPHEQLQADCDERVQEIHPGGVLPPPEPFVIPDSAEPDRSHLTVAGEVPRRPGLVQVHEPTWTKPGDAALFVDPPQGPELYTGPDYPDHFPTKEH